MLLELPHAAGCLVCGRHNPHGLHLSLHVNTDTGAVTCDFTPQPHHVGFEGIIHGGLLATVVDEAMVWAATWTGRLFCVCGEMSIRFRTRAKVGVPLLATARIEAARPKLILVTSTITSVDNALVAQATGKYVPISAEESRRMLDSLLKDPATAPACHYLQG